MSKAESRARSPSDEELRRITRRAVAEIIPEDEFVKALRSGRRLRLKMGFDPTKPIITLGWAVGLRKLRQLQELGHTVVVIIGDWTARIGDPSGESQTRRMLPTKEVRENANKILDQFFKILHRDLTKVRWQREWFDRDRFPLTKLATLASRVTVSMMLERDDFERRFKSGKPIRLQEFIYPLLQAYDSVMVEADVEFGGTDQRFNILLGRELQPKYGQKPQCAFLVPLLAGYRGDGKKMSQSLDNYIGIDDPPHDMYGKIMSIPDSLLLDYFELLTDVPEEELAFIRRSLKKRSAKAMEHKMRLAREIVSQFHSAEAAEAAEGEFERVFRQREAPEEMRSLPVSMQGNGSSDVDIAAILVSCGVASRSEARRLLAQGAIEVDGEKITRQQATVRDGSVIRVGKHRFLRIVDADRQG